MPMKRTGRRLTALWLAALLASFLAPPAAAEPEPVRIAFIDSGVSLKHLDEWKVAEGKNYVFPEADTGDRIGHGTATAGLVLGSEDLGVDGVCPAAVAVPLVVVDTYPSGVVKNGGPEALCQAIRDAVDLYGCRIINISLCTTEDSDALREAAAYAEENGAVLIAAVGNLEEEEAVYYPAAYETVLSVGSAVNGAPASFSQPNADLWTEGAGLVTATNKNGREPAVVSGTSYSCALVSGVAARVIEAYPDMTPAGLRKALRTLAEERSRQTGSLLFLEPDVPVPTRYLDVPDGLWSREAVLRVSERGIMNGTGGGLFEPERTVSRAMAATVLYRLAGSPGTTGETAFSDIGDGLYYTEAVAWALGEGIVNGYGNGRFGPDDPVTREQLVTMIWRYEGEPAADGGILTEHLDFDRVSPWAEEAFAWTLGEGVIRGKGNGQLDPAGFATRGELAQILTNLDGR